MFPALPVASTAQPPLRSLAAIRWAV